MEIITGEDGVTTIRLEGRFDSSITENFKQSIKELCDKGEIFHVIDMKGVSYIDSSGLGSIVASLRQIRQLNGDLKVACLNEQVLSIFQLTRCHRLVEIYDDSQAAAASFNKPPKTR